MVNDETEKVIDFELARKRQLPFQRGRPTAGIEKRKKFPRGRAGKRKQAFKNFSINKNSHNLKHWLQFVAIVILFYYATHSCSGMP